MLALEGVVKHYRSGDEDIPAIDDVNLRVAAGEMVALHGPSGSGKTTLLLLIAGLLRPERGSISYQGRDIGSFTEKQASEYLMREVGFVYQRFQLMAKVSAVENASRKLWLSGMGMSERSAGPGSQLARGAWDWDRLEHPPEKLSGGERQRVAIARALAADPRLILADEPTGSLDSARSRQIIELLQWFAHERDAAVLLVTHDLEAAAMADRGLTLRDGKLTEDRSRQDTDVPSAANEH